MSYIPILILVFTSISSMINSNEEVRKLGRGTYIGVSLISWASMFTLWLSKYNILYNERFMALKKAKNLTKKERTGNFLNSTHVEKPYNKSLEYMREDIMPKVLTAIVIAIVVMILIVIVARILNKILENKKTFLPLVDNATFSYLRKNVFRLVIKFVFGALLAFYFIV